MSGMRYKRTLRTKPVLLETRQRPTPIPPIIVEGPSRAEARILDLAPHMTAEEVDPFCKRVTQIGKIVKGLASEDEEAQKKAIRRADVLLHGGTGKGTFEPIGVTSEQSEVAGGGDGPCPCPVEHTSTSEVLIEDCSEDSDAGGKSHIPGISRTGPHRAGGDGDVCDAPASKGKNLSGLKAAEEGILNLLDLADQLEKMSLVDSDVEEAIEGETPTAGKPVEVDDANQAAQPEEPVNPKDHPVEDPLYRLKMGETYRRKGNVAFRAMSFSEAVFYYGKACELMPEKAYSFSNRAQAYLAAGLPQSALDDLKIAFKMKSNSLRIRLLMSRAYFNLAQPQKAKQWLESSRKRFPDFESMIKEYEQDLFELKMERHLQTSAEAREAENLKQARRIPMLSDTEEKWQKLGRHELCIKVQEDEGEKPSSSSRVTRSTMSKDKE